ncbi:phosphoenolpyruvate--protein phosphotransferase [Aquisalinus flavus]|uniref:phosphoenolpyruvate--protein phosphotransferase n=1 Tax=Aquisalinus flavus TaxID=1526572 RepID=UPI00165EFEC2|nr:phosphoenolpyruvate--protein phosphotransferase [Aquisalinus flavus]MBD0427854.1 phosphoenolpyruvate--protein phosphotransferase [Aquisalinus flavus]UNE47620.1 phosphoenolpyruvate--protein phosphotransferase [Aquisalinus flavus]
MPIDSSIRLGTQTSSPRVLLKRLREVMAAEEGAQQRLDHLTNAIANNMVADVCSIYLRRADDMLELFSTQGLNPEAVHNTRMKWSEGLVGYVARTAEPINLRDAPKHPSFSFRPEVGEELLNAFLGVPIIRTGQVLGVLVIQNKAVREYTEEEVEAAQIVATVLAEIVAAGDLLEEADAQEVDRVLHRHEHLVGAPIVAGIAIGTVALHEPPAPKHRVFADNVAEEGERLQTGLESLRKSIDDMIAANQDLATVSREVLEVYRLFAYDKGWARRLEDAVQSGLTAESAVEQVQGENRKRMRQAKDPYIRERMHDLDDLSRRLLRSLGGDAYQAQLELPQDAVLLARSLGPAEILELDRNKLKGIVLGEGSDTSHAAIVARSLGIPLLGKCPAVIDKAEIGDRIIVDGGTGEIHLRPGSDIISSYEDKLAIYSEEQKAYAALRDLPAVTRDGTEIELFLNAGLAIDMPHLEATGAVGIGLFRTELQFLIGPQLPTAQEQEMLYRSILDGAGNKSIVFRTADLGSDKAATYMKMSHEANPAMGWRGLRMSIDREGLIRPQLRALIAAAEGRELNILLPLVTTSDEIVQARAIIDKEIERRKRQDKPLPSAIKLGAMIEIPSAAWRVEHIAPLVDFLSLGGNDLAQFFFAADRESDKLTGRYDPLHPAFLSFLKMIADKANLANKPICYCGEQAADPLMAMALMALDIQRLSVPASSIGPLKKMIRSIDLNELVAWLEPRLQSSKQTLRDELLEYAYRNGVAL